MALFPDYPELGTAPCVPDRVILPGEEAVTLFGATFGILRTPGHTVDHICVRTPDDVLYVADAMMTGRTLHYAKFPYALSMETYLDSMVKLREAKAACYVVAHKGIYEDIRPFIDLELQFLRQRMEELAGPAGGPHHPQAAHRGHLQKIPGGHPEPPDPGLFRARQRGLPPLPGGPGPGGAPGGEGEPGLPPRPAPRPGGGGDAAPRGGSGKVSGAEAPVVYGPYRPCLLDRPRGAAPRGGVPAGGLHFSCEKWRKEHQGLCPWTPVFKAARCSLAPSFGIAAQRDGSGF